MTATARARGAPLPIVHTIPLQLLAYHTAVMRGTDVDKPRNLAKALPLNDGLGDNRAVES